MDVWALKMNDQMFDQKEFIATANANAIRLLRAKA